jgi:hypothetical protein
MDTAIIHVRMPCVRCGRDVTVRRFVHDSENSASSEYHLACAIGEFAN